MDAPVDYHIAQYADRPDPKKNMNSSEVYLVAAHREWNSYIFYKSLAALQPAGEVQEMLLQMANQELKHKEKVEYLSATPLSRRRPAAEPQAAGMAKGNLQAPAYPRPDLIFLVIGVYLLSLVIPSGSSSGSKRHSGGGAVTVPGTYDQTPQEFTGGTPVAPHRPHSRLPGRQPHHLPDLYFRRDLRNPGEAPGPSKRNTEDVRLFLPRPEARGPVVPVLMVVFSLAGGVYGMAEESIPFVLIFIPLAMSLGYDSIVGVAIPFIGAAVGFAAAFFNPFTVGIAQGFSDLPLYSGLGYRLVLWVVGTV